MTRNDHIGIHKTKYLKHIYNILYKILQHIYNNYTTYLNVQMYNREQIVLYNYNKAEPLTLKVQVNISVCFFSILKLVIGNLNPPLASIRFLN